MNFEITKTIPRTNVTVLISYTSDGYNGIDEFYTHIDSQEVDLTGLYVDLSPLCAEERKVVGFDEWVLGVCEEDVTAFIDQQRDDCRDYNRYVSQHRLTASQLGIQ